MGLSLLRSCGGRCRNVSVPDAPGTADDGIQQLLDRPRIFNFQVPNLRNQDRKTRIPQYVVEDCTLISLRQVLRILAIGFGEDSEARRIQQYEATVVETSPDELIKRSAA